MGRVAGKRKKEFEDSASTGTFVIVINFMIVIAMVYGACSKLHISTSPHRPANLLTPTFVSVLPSSTTPFPSKGSPSLSASSVNTFPASLVGLIIAGEAALTTGNNNCSDTFLNADFFGTNSLISLWAEGSTAPSRTLYALKVGSVLESDSIAASARPFTTPKRGVKYDGVVVAPSPDM